MLDHVIRRPCEACQDGIPPLIDILVCVGSESGACPLAWSIYLWRALLAQGSKLGQRSRMGGRRDKALLLHITRPPLSLSVSHHPPHLLSSLYHRLRLHPTSYSPA